MVCNKQLSTGEELYVIDENKFVCKEDYVSSGAIKEVNLNSGNQRENKPRCVCVFSCAKQKKKKKKSHLCGHVVYLIWKTCEGGYYINAYLINKLETGLSGDK